MTPGVIKLLKGVKKVKAKVVILVGETVLSPD